MIQYSSGRRSHTQTLAPGLCFLTLIGSLIAFQHNRPLNCFSAREGASGVPLPQSRLQPTSEFNRRLLLEEDEFRRRFDVQSVFFVIPDDNAYAEPGGNVLLGQQLADHYVNNHDAAYALQALAYVAAHEYGHELQFRITNNHVSAGPESELQADAIAGYWIGMRLSEQVSQGVLPDEAYKIIELDKGAAYDIGDYLFGNPQHHGTPQQRHSAVDEGIKMGYARRLGANFQSYSDAKKLYDTTLAIVAQLR